MKQVTQHAKTGTITLSDVPVPALKDGSVLVQTRFSMISTGTERASLESKRQSLIARARKQPELINQVLDQIRSFGLLATYRRVKRQLDRKLPIGYSVAGDVVAVGAGVTNFKPGDRVACMGAGYANHAEYVLVPMNLCTRIPRKVTYDEACFTTVGAIALQGVRQAEPRVGETVVVIGLGLVGQLTVQVLKASGCRVIGIDLQDAAVALARKLGADLSLRRSGDVRGSVRSFTQGRGADSVIITAATPKNDPVVLAADLARDKGRIVLVGDVGLELPRTPFYMKELDFRLSRSTGPGRYDVVFEEEGGTYPESYVRWTETGNMQEFLRLIGSGSLDVRPLITHQFPIADAQRAFRLVAGPGTPKSFVAGVLLDYEDPERRSDSLLSTVQLHPGSHTAGPRGLRLGFLGAGTFAQASLLPFVQRYRGVTLDVLCTANGLSGINSGRQFGFSSATTDPAEIFSNEKIGSVFITTRHGTHAEYIIKSLLAGKNVFVEKPLAISLDELRSIVDTYRNLIQSGEKSSRGKQESGSDPGGVPILMVGFNRRFSPHATHVKRFFEDAVGPLMIQYRVNAGYVPRTHWARSDKDGGGRIIGEVCHFVDLMQYFTGSDPVRVYAEPLAPTNMSIPDDDSAAITIRFADGSVGIINYCANGDPKLPKERVEISSTGRSAVIDNFKRLELYLEGRQRVFKKGSIQKGHREEVHAFLSAVRSGSGSPVPFNSLVATTMTTFRIAESLRLGIPLEV